jgi:hypothetical protein
MVLKQLKDPSRLIIWVNEIAFLTPPFLGGNLLRTGIVSGENETFYNHSCEYNPVI